MKKYIWSFLLSICLVFNVFAVDVSKEELQNSGTADSIVFENYSGPHAVIESANAITGIGIDLGTIVAQDVNSSVIARPEGKYTLIHIVDTENTEGLDADILVLNANAGVDHIRNLRRIISGYLQAAYGYDVSDAETISVFVTVYNAVYRNQIDVFSQKYKTQVLDNLTQESVGLSLNWEEWAGNTQIVIPLAGEVSSVETSVISDEQVIEALKKEDDKGTEVREKMAEIKERESKDAAAKANSAQKDASEHKASAKNAPDKEQATKEKQQAEQSGKVAAEQQQIADRKKAEAHNERQSIEHDKENITPTSTEKNDDYVTVLVGPNNGGLFSLVVIDNATGIIIKTSPIKQIRSKGLFSISNVNIIQEDGSTVNFPLLYVAVCGANSGKSAIKLCLIDPDQLEICKETEEALADGTQVLQYNNDFYVVIQSASNSYLALYDQNLELKAKSELAVKASTPLNITSKGLLVTDTKGNPRLLNINSLQTIW